MRSWSLNYRDLLIARGAYVRGVPPQLVPVSDGVGDVVALGEGVEQWSVGDRVSGVFMPRWRGGPPSAVKISAALGGSVDGLLAEYVVFDEEALVGIPPYLSFEEAATLPCAGVTAWHALFSHGGLAPGETVLTLGSGGVSLFALQLAAAAGARVVSTSSSDEKLERLRKLGASEVINYVETPNWGEAARRLTGGGVDHVVDIGGAGTLPQSFAAARIGGRVSMIGILAPAAGVDPLPALTKGLLMQGMLVGSREVFQALNRAITATGVRPVIDRVYGFDEATDAYRRLASGANFGKVVITAET
jgi:NADPH:quinone reductase-like Zn-dependent oxidoreductase